MTGDDKNISGGGAKRGAGTSAAYAVPALTKAVEVLELLADEPVGLTATDISARLDRSMGELYRLIVAMQRLGLLSRDERDERYSLSLKLFEMSHRHPPTARLVQSALPVLEALARQSEQSAHLAALAGDMLVILAQVESPRAMHYAVRVGASFPVLETSSGIVIIAHSEQRVQDHYLAHLPKDERDAMRQRFADARRLGYECRDSSAVTGVVNISRPVFNHAGVPHAAVTVPYLGQTRSRVDIDGTLPMVIATADELSHTLGWIRPAATDAGTGTDARGRADAGDGEKPKRTRTK